MGEDKLDQEQRIRLEALTVAMNFTVSSIAPNERSIAGVIDTADTVAKFIKDGSTPTQREKRETQGYF